MSGEGGRGGKLKLACNLGMRKWSMDCDECFSLAGFWSLSWPARMCTRCALAGYLFVPSVWGWWPGHPGKVESRFVGTVAERERESYLIPSSSPSSPPCNKKRTEGNQRMPLIHKSRCNRCLCLFSCHAFKKQPIEPIQPGS